MCRGQQQSGVAVRSLTFTAALSSPVCVCSTAAVDGCVAAAAPCSFVESSSVHRRGEHREARFSSTMHDSSNK
uniref:Putative secreted protein n=1 Tax=Anopheles marajoara TaxID=58244 RepID=A0A2M4CDT6_9DIPT